MLVLCYSCCPCIIQSVKDLEAWLKWKYRRYPKEVINTNNIKLIEFVFCQLKIVLSLDILTVMSEVISVVHVL